MRIAATVGRVEEVTPWHINEMIQRDIECSAIFFAEHPEQIAERLADLDDEWNIERVLQVQASSVVLIGLVMSIVRGRKWLGLSAFSGYFLLQHARQGWCPPVAVFRRLGVRTAREIEIERHALKALRGDFGEVGTAGDPLKRAHAALDAARDDEAARRFQAMQGSRSGEKSRHLGVSQVRGMSGERRRTPEKGARRFDRSEGGPGMADGV